ncbi:MAG: GNAT family N-acetyltransferase [Bacteroidota bacterium]
MIKGERINLRAVEPYDRDLMYAWENDTRNWHVSGTLSPFSKHTVDEFLKNAKEDIYTSRQLRLAIDLNEHPQPRTIGYIDLFDFEPPHRRAGVGVLIGEQSDRGKGLATESLQLLCGYAKDVLNLHQLYCHIHQDNHSSIKLFTKAGFVPCGELKDWTFVSGQWKHVGVFQKLLNP